MNPIKFKEIVSLTAEQLGERPEVVASVLQLYFKELRGALSVLAHPRVQVLNLGTFCLKLSAVEKRLVRKQVLLDKLSGAPEHNPVLKQEVEQEVLQLAASLTLMGADQKRKNIVKKNRQSNDAESI